MKIGSFVHQGAPGFGVFIDEGIIDLGTRMGGRYRDLPALLRAFALDQAAEATAGKSPDFGLDEVMYLPLMPSPVNIYCCGINYLDHIDEMGNDRPEHPVVFIKTLQSLVGHNRPIIRPRVSEQFDFEGEFALVIGRPGRYVRGADWRDYVAGYTILMDGSVRDYQNRALDMGKNFHASSSLGPWMITLDEASDDFADMAITTRLNEEVVQSSTLDQLCFGPADLLAAYSEVFHLQPGDIISTGTPAGVGLGREPKLWMKAGDTIDVDITGIGTLTNPVEDE